MKFRRAISRMKYYTRKSINDSVCQDIITRTYRFGKIGEEPFSGSFVFKKDFTIDGYFDENEKYWGVYGETLRIFDVNKRLTSQFNIVNDGVDYLSGKSLKYSTVKFELKSVVKLTKNTEAIKLQQLKLSEDEQAIFKIQNMILPPKLKNNTNVKTLYYKGDDITEFKGINIVDGFSDFTTYLNMLSIKKWSNYTQASDFALSFKGKGKFKLNLVYTTLDPKNKYVQKIGLENSFEEIKNTQIDDIFKRNVMNYQSTETEVIREIVSYQVDLSELTEIVLPVSKHGHENAMVGVQIEGTAQFLEVAWAAVVKKNAIRPVNIILNTTTFQKEKYILKNLKHIQDQIFDIKPEADSLNSLGQHFFVNVVDNGRTLEAERLNSDRVRIFGNPNVGGAGGFTRGMIETLNLRDKGEFDATHILFMDDDIEVLPESFKRTYALLSILKDSYKDHFVSGAMLDSLDGITQYEDTGFISRNKDTAYLPTKDRYNLTDEKDILRNDLEYPIKDQYAAWWYCVAPIKFIHENSMSLPIFYRGDDIEFSIRNQAKIMTLNGLAVWHLPFYTKKSKALENYLVPRNSFIDQSVNGFLPDVDYLSKYIELYKKEIRFFNYGAADQVLDALDDYMKGPAYIASLDGIEVIKREGAKNEVFTDDIPEVIKKNLHTANEYHLLNPADQAVFIESDNGHGLPDFALNKFDDELKNVEIVNQEMLENAGKQFMKKRLVVFDTYNKKIAIRERNQEKYEAVEARLKTLTAKFDQEKDQIAQDYRDYADKFHSKAFWVDYLGLEER